MYHARAPLPTWQNHSHFYRCGGQWGPFLQAVRLFVQTCDGPGCHQLAAAAATTSSYRPETTVTTGQSVRQPASQPAGAASNALLFQVRPRLRRYSVRPPVTAWAMRLGMKTAEK